MVACRLWCSVCGQARATGAGQNVGRARPPSPSCTSSHTNTIRVSTVLSRAALPAGHLEAATSGGRNRSRQAPSEDGQQTRCSTDVAPSPGATSIP